MNRVSRFVAVVAALALLVPGQQAAAAAFRALSLPEGAPVSAPLTSAPVALPSLAATPSLAAPLSALPALPVPATAVATVIDHSAGATPPASQTSKPAALPALQKLAAEASSAKPGSSRAGAALNRSFDLSNAGSEGGEPSAVLGSESPRESGLAPSSPSSPSPRRTPPSRFSSQRGAANVKLIAVIGGVVLAVAIALGALIHHGQKQDAFWKGSKAAADIVSIERAKRAGDDASLYTLAREARARQAQESEQVADAKVRHADTIGSRKVSDVEKLAAFDGLAAARAELAANALSGDATRRLGAEKPCDWQSRLAALDAQAKASGSDGAVARELDKLGAEVSREQAADQRLQGDLQAFEAKVPSIGGGLLKEQDRLARAELSSFENGELGAESALYANELAAVRGRVYDRLSASSAEFNTHAEHRQALSALEGGSLKSAVELAQGIDDNLSDMATHLANKTAALKDAEKLDAEADQLTHVPVYVQAKDAQGQPMFDGQGRPVQVLDHYEDQSGPKRDAAKAKRDEARSEADQARGLAISADRSAVALRTLVAALRRDPAVLSEGLGSSLPARVPDVRVYIGYDWYDIGSADLDFFLNQLTEQEANEVRARFGGVVEPLKQARAEVSARRSAESAWLDQRVSQELAREKAGR